MARRAAGRGGAHAVRRRAAAPAQIHRMGPALRLRIGRRRDRGPPRGGPHRARPSAGPAAVAPVPGRPVPRCGSAGGSAGASGRRAAAPRLHPAAVPFGLVHPDHRLAHAAALAAWRRLPGTEAWAYEDCPYRREPGALQRRLVELAGAGVVATPSSGSGRASRRAKALAIDAYRSQWLALGAAAREDVCRPEGIWSLRIEP